MDNLGIVLMLAGFVLSFCCAVNAIRGKPNKKTWYSMIAAYISFGICYAISERDARNIGIAFMLICFCYIVKVVWGFLKAAIKHLVHALVYRVGIRYRSPISGGIGRWVVKRYTPSP